MSHSTSPIAPPATALILAAGKGTRMKSARAKVLHEIGARALIAHVLELVKSLGIGEAIVVKGPGMEDVAAAAGNAFPAARIATQTEQLGTGDAVKAGLALRAGAGDVLILYGDTPLIRPETIREMGAEREKGADIVILAFRPDVPGGYGRIIASRLSSRTHRVERIVEAADARPQEREINLCNSGIMLVDGKLLPDLISRLTNKNAKGEFYLTDIVAHARAAERRTNAIEIDESEVVGVNSRAELAAAEAIFQKRRRREAMEAGVTLIDPETVYFAADTKIGPDTLIEPQVFFGPGVTIEGGAHIHAFSHIEGAKISAGASIGPFARIRPGTDVGANVKIGNFVETKKARIEAGAKVSHLTYIGDARIGAEANIGAGTITCNYDGFDKHFTDIGAGAFIGSNSALVAPVKIGDGAYIGSGSVITKDVPKDALAIARGEQTAREEWAAKFRTRKTREKARKE